MTSLSDKVARVKELQANCYPDGIRDAQALGYAIFMFKQEADNMAALIIEQDAIIQQQREEIADAELAQGALASIRALLDDGKIPRGTFADDQVRNLVAMYNQQREALKLAREVFRDLCRPYTGNPEDKTLEDIFGDAMIALTAIDNVMKGEV